MPPETAAQRRAVLPACRDTRLETACTTRWCGPGRQALCGTRRATPAAVAPPLTLCPPVPKSTWPRCSRTTGTVGLSGPAAQANGTPSRRTAAQPPETCTGGPESARARRCTAWQAGHLHAAFGSRARRRATALRHLQTRRGRQGRWPNPTCTSAYLGARCPSLHGCVPALAAAAASSSLHRRLRYAAPCLPLKRYRYGFPSRGGFPASCSCPPRLTYAAVLWLNAAALRSCPLASGSRSPSQPSDAPCATTQLPVTPATPRHQRWFPAEHVSSREASSTSPRNAGSATPWCAPTAAQTSAAAAGSCPVPRWLKAASTAVCSRPPPQQGSAANSKRDSQPSSSRGSAAALEAGRRSVAKLHCTVHANKRQRASVSGARVHARVSAPASCVVRHADRMQLAHA
eukprot:359828-Chlamydomonas_euryale.AAC.4